MKKIIYSILAATALLAPLTSCDDYLALESPDQLTSGSFWRDENDAMAGLAAAYSQLEYYISTWGFAEVKWPVEAFREDIINIGADVPNYASWMELYNFSLTSGNSAITSYWRNNYTGISFCNQVLEKVGTIPASAISDSKRKEILAEARFLRAYYHIKLILNFEKIIVRDHYITNQADLSAPLSDRAATWDFIMDDLKQAAADLKDKHDADNVGRATSGAAWAYLGMANLFRSNEEPAQKQKFLNDALTAFNNVKGYELEKDFLSMFNATNKNCKESIFELQTSMNSAGGANYRTALQYWIACAELGGWDEILPSEMLMNEFKKEGQTASTGRYDSRLYSTVFFKCDYFNDGSGRVFGSDYNDWFEGADRPAFRKFLPADREGMEADYCAINIPLMRYANVMLMKAEVLNELNRTNEAIPLINEVRKVHGDMPAMKGSSQQEVRDQIEHERIIEFPLENWRWYDLRRWGKTDAALKKAGRAGYSESRSFFPVPLSETNANDKI